MNINSYDNLNALNHNFIFDKSNKASKILEKEREQKYDYNPLNLNQFKHPLFLNYNYCLFCGTKRKTKYFDKNLYDSHKSYESIEKFMILKRIYLNPCKNKIEKLAKRRIFHSFDCIESTFNRMKTKNKFSKNEYKNCNSDTELFVSLNIQKDNNCKIFVSSNNSLNSKVYDIKRNLFFSVTDHNKINSEIFQNNKFNLINSKRDHLNHDINEGKNLRNQKRVKQSFTFEDEIDTTRRGEINRNENRLKSAKIEENINSSILRDNNKKNDDILFDTNTKLSRRSESEFDEQETKLNKSTEKKSTVKKREFVREEENKNEINFKDKIENSSNITNDIKESKINKKINVDNLLKKHSKKFEDDYNYSNKNDECVICTNKIDDKFVLSCGDFYCKSCITDHILYYIYNVNEFDKMRCPKCKEPIKIESINLLLTNEELIKYKKIEKKIEGLKRKDLIPCPYRDCEEFAKFNKTENKILKCKDGHKFCYKCMEAIDEPKKESPLKQKKLSNNVSNNSSIKESSEIEEIHHICGELHKKTMDYLNRNKNIRKCPNCNAWVEREKDGCNNMICTNLLCGYKFCWICGEHCDTSHYKNPFSPCFGLGEIKSEDKLAKNKRSRLFRCILIFLVIIFIILPIVIALFSFFEIFIYAITFVFDGTSIKRIKLHSKLSHHIFYGLIYSFYFLCGLAFIPLGYISLALFILSIPIIFIYNKCKKEPDEEIY